VSAMPTSAPSEQPAASLSPTSSTVGAAPASQAPGSAMRATPAPAKASVKDESDPYAPAPGPARAVEGAREGAPDQSSTPGVPKPKMEKTPEF
jgi:hypothetical protein